MYSWYFPKDEPSTGIGHRHDWEGVIVWLSDSSSTAASNVLAVCPSAHGGWDCSTSDFTLDGTSPLIKYESIWPVDHSLGLTTTVGGTQPMVAWESLSSMLCLRKSPFLSKESANHLLQVLFKMLWTPLILLRPMCLLMRTTGPLIWQRQLSEMRTVADGNDVL